MGDSHLPLDIEDKQFNKQLDTPQVNQLNNVKPNKNRRNLILLLIVFALPIVLAKLALENKWLDQGVTNKGTLLKNQLTLSQLGIDVNEFNQQWLIIYYQPTSCLSYCEQELTTVYNSYIAIGKDKPRVSTILLANDNIQAAQKNWKFIQASTQASTLLQQEIGNSESIKASQVYIVDPLGNFILRHALPQPDKLESLATPPISNQYLQLNLAGKAILADMKKLLKYSKVG